MGSFGTTEIIVIVLIVLILFGGKKIPELMRGLGTGVKEFKKATDLNEPDETDRRRGYDRLEESRLEERRLEERRLEERRLDEERRLEQDRRSDVR
jgi:sec-independent protein translocase protein TatA